MKKKDLPNAKKVLGLRRKLSHGTETVTSVQSVRDIELRYQVVTMRRDGYTIQEIADTLSISQATARLHLTKSLTETIKNYQETTEESRQLQLDRLDALVRTYTPLAKGHTEMVPDTNRPGQMKEVWVAPNVNAGIFLLNIEQRRSKLLALDVPEIKKLEVSGVREYVGICIDDV
jgi:predicted transcriptional regulator